MSKSLLFLFLFYGYHLYSMGVGFNSGISLLEFLLFLVLGWAVFGKPVQ